jgi:hypothetical protein
MLRPDVILKYRVLYASAGQVASGKWQERKQTNKKIKEKRKGRRIEKRDVTNKRVYKYVKRRPKCGRK